MSQSTAIRIKVLSCAVILLILAQAFNASLSITSFEKLYLSTVMSGHQIFGRDLRRNIENAVRFGKPLEKFFGIQGLIEEVKRNNADLDNVVVALPEGRVIYSLDADLVGQPLPSGWDLGFQETLKETDDVKKFLDQGFYHLVFPLKDRRDRWIGTLDLSFDEALIKHKIQDIILWNLLVLGITTLVVIGILTGWLTAIVDLRQAQPFSKTKIAILLLVVIGGSQLFYSAFNINLFQRNYLDILRSTTQSVGNLLKDDVEFLLSRDIKLDRLVRVDVLLNEILESTPVLEEIQITNRQKEILYLANREEVVQLAEGESSLKVEEVHSEDYEINLPLNKYWVGKYQNQAAEGFVRMHLSQDKIQDQIQEIVLDSLTVVLISMLFVVELSLFLLIFIFKQVDKATENSELDDSIPAYGVIRPVVFLYLFSMEMSASFLPLHMGNLYEPLFGLPKDVVLGLPISMEMLFTGIALFIATAWMAKKGWHVSFIGGAILSIIGVFLSGVATTALTFIAARALSGFGYGIAIMSTEGFIMKHAKANELAKGFSSLAAGILAGSICGGAVGAMLAERIGYSQVFYVASVLAILSLIFTLLFMRDSFSTPELTKETEARFQWSTLFRFLFSRDIVALIQMNIIPTSLIITGFLTFLVPVYLDQIGTSQSNIGRVLMIFGILMIYFAPAVSPLIDRSKNKGFYIILTGLIGSAGLLVFYFQDGFLGVMLTTFMLGVAYSFGNSSQMTFPLDLESTKRFGEESTMSVLRASERVGDALGPIVIGIVIATVSAKHAIVGMGAVYFVMTLLFILLTLKRTKKLQDTSHD